MKKRPTFKQSRQLRKKDRPKPNDFEVDISRDNALLKDPGQLAFAACTPKQLKALRKP